MDFFRRHRHQIKRSTGGSAAARITISQAFEIAYGRAISPMEVKWLSKAGACGGDTDAAVLRAVIAAFDRQTYPTPVTVRFMPEQLATVDLGAFKLVLDALDVSVSRPIMAAKDYEGHLRRFVESVLRPGMTFIDVGANVGYYSMLAASIVGKTGKVLAFEPNSENNRLILLSVGENDFPQIELFPFALTESAGAAYFSPMVGSNGGLMPNTRETLSHPNCTVVACQRLDSLVTNRVDFIKVDIEGAEYRALSGAIELIKRWRPVITTEFSIEMLSRVSLIGGGDFLKWMIGFGYEVQLLRRDGTGAQKISNVDLFLGGWGNPLRIEDLAFLPRPE